MRALLASLVVCAIGCGSRAEVVRPLRSVEVVLQPIANLARYDIHAAFPANQDPSSHIQPIASAIASARPSCTEPMPAALLELEIHRKRLQARARSVTATCLAKALDGVAIADSDIVVELLVNG